MAPPILSWNKNTERGFALSDSNAETFIEQLVLFFQNEGSSSNWELVDHDSVNFYNVMIKPKSGSYVNDRLILSRHYTPYVLDSSNYTGDAVAQSGDVYIIYCPDAAISTIPDLTSGPAVSGGYTGGGQSSAHPAFKSSTLLNRIDVYDNTDGIVFNIRSASFSAIFVAGRLVYGPDDTLYPIISTLGDTSSTFSDFWGRVDTSNGILFSSNNYFDKDGALTQVKIPSEIFTLCARVSVFNAEDKVLLTNGDVILFPVGIGSYFNTSYLGQLRQLKFGQRRTGVGAVVQSAVHKAYYCSAHNATISGALYMTEDL